MSRQNKPLLDSEKFFKRICEALEIQEGFGAQAKIAEIVGITKSSVGNWREGGMPGKESLQNVAKVAELSNVSLHWLLTGKGPKFIDRGKGIDFNETFREAIREIVKEELASAQSDIQDFGAIDEFDIAAEIEKGHNAGTVLSAWYRHDRLPAPNLTGVAFSDWSKLKLADKVREIKRVRRSIDDDLEFKRQKRGSSKKPEHS